MSPLVTYGLGVLSGLVIFWIGYQIAWQQWNKHHNRDKAYLQEKLRSEQNAKTGLERQLADLKSNAAGQRAQMGELERLNRLALTREEKANEEKQAVVALLDVLRAEIAIYKKILAEQGKTPSPTALPRANGKSSGKSNGGIAVAGTYAVDAYMIGAEPAAADAKAAHPAAALPEYEMVLAHTNGNGKHKNGSGNGKTPVLYGTANIFPPADPLTEPVMYIERPRMKGDRLEIIPGITPTLLSKLRKDGIDTFLDLSGLTAEALRAIAGPKAGQKIDAEGILAQAKKLAAGRKPAR